MNSDIQIRMKVWQFILTIIIGSIVSSTIADFLVRFVIGWMSTVKFLTS